MATTINADTSTGGAIVTGDASGVLGLQAAGSTQVTISTSGVVLANPLPVASGGTGGSATPTAGGVVYGTGTAQAVTTAGTATYLLQSNGASAPSWVAPPSASAMTLISTQTASSSASLSWTGLSGYNNYIIVLDGIAPSTTNAYLLFQVGTGAGPTYITTSYINNDLVVIGNGSPSNSLNSNTTGIIAIGGGQTIGVRSTSYVSGRVSLFNMTNSLLTNCEYAASYQDQVNNMFTLGLGNGNTSNTTAKTAIKILWTSGNIASGTASLYGITT